MKTKALVAGSFDPVHFGHLDIINRAARDFDLTVLVANSSQKNYMFALDERVKLMRDLLDKNIFVDSLSGNKLTVDYAFEHNISVIVRGIRNLADYDYEKMLRDVNLSQQNGIETYFLNGDPKLSHISSTAAKELFRHAGFIHEYVPLLVKREMERKSGVTIIGVTGNIASGKNWYCDKIYNAAPNVYHLDVDKVAHRILFESDVPAHKHVRMKIREEFNIAEYTPTEFTDDPLTTEERVSLGNMVFSDAGKREKLNSIMYQPLLTEIRKAISDKKGLVLINAALLAEFKMTHICNNNVVMVVTDEETRVRRMRARKYTEDQIKHRISSQYSDERKHYHIMQAIKKDGYGKIFKYQNDGSTETYCNLLYKTLKEEFDIC